MTRIKLAAACVLAAAALAGCAAHKQDTVIEDRIDAVIGAWQAGAYEIMWSNLGPTMRAEVSKRRFIEMQELIEQAVGRLKSATVTSLTPAWKQGPRLFAPAIESGEDTVLRQYILNFDRGTGQLFIAFQLRDGMIQMTRYEFHIPQLEQPAYNRKFHEILSATY